ncbi:MAG TPA: sensor histidine kinase [Bryobacteraceae bacterium]|nr:sensor histidine kinase [Bryobacteraceae bacterium]
MEAFETGSKMRDGNRYRSPAEDDAQAGKNGLPGIPAERGLRKTGAVVLLGFGVLLTLLILCGLNALHVLSELQTSNETILRDFLQEQQRLDKIRSEIYLSGTYLRDYLLEPNPEKAEQNRIALENARAQVESILADPQALAGSGGDEMYHALQREIAEYWNTLDPVLSWKPAQRHNEGYRFLHDEVFPRRSSTLAIADTIASVNQGQLLNRDNRLLSLFSRFRNQLMIALLLMVVFGVIQASATTIHLLGMERRNVRHLIEMTEARQELRSLSAKLVTTQENERKNLSRELHDAVGQSLSAVQFELHDLAMALPQDQLRGRVDRIRELVESSLAMIRNMARLLRPAMLDDLGLATALEWQAREIARSTGLQINVRTSAFRADLPDEHKTCVFRIVQEALNNVCRHANADSVEIALGTSGSRVTVSIQDNGRGFRREQSKGLGMIGMQERVENLGGTLNVHSEPGKGTRIDASLPFPQQIASTGEPYRDTEAHFVYPAKG